MKSAFITGGAGFIGLNLIGELAREGWDVTALYLPGENIHDLTQFNVRLIDGNILDTATLKKAIPDRVEVVFHLAGDTSTWSKNNERQYRINVVGTSNVLATAIEKKAGRFIFTSSISAFGFHDGPVSEDTVSRAMESGVNYHKTKFIAEQEIKKKSGLIQTVILNPCNVIGPYDRVNWAQTIQSVYQDKLSGYPPGIGTFAHVRDIACAHVSAAKKESIGPQYVLGGTQASFKDAFNTIAEILHKKPIQKALSKTVLRFAVHLFTLKSLLDQKEPVMTMEKYKRLVGKQIIDDRRAVSDLGLKKISLKEMFTDSYRWLLQEKLLVK